MLTIQECRNLLNITTRQTINEYLKSFNFFGQRTLTWDEFRKLLELQTFLGLKAGTNSKAEFLTYSPNELRNIFALHAIDIEEKLKRLKQKHANNVVRIVEKNSRAKTSKNATLASGAVARNGKEL
jgi:hypothetical protein